MTVVFADALPDIRYWLRNQPDLNALHAGRVFFRLPAQPGGWPLMRIYQHGGAPVELGGDAPLDELLVSVECWHNQPAGYQQARQLTVALRSVLHFLPAGTVLNPSSSTVALAAAVTNVIDSPDPDSGWPRLVCDTRWTIQALQ